MERTGLLVRDSREGELRGLCAGFEDAVFDAGVEEVYDGLFGDGEALGLDEGASVLGDGVEFFLKGCGGHACFILRILRAQAVDSLRVIADAEALQAALGGHCGGGGVLDGPFVVLDMVLPLPG